MAWSSAYASAGDPSLSSIACPTVRVCIAVGGPDYGSIFRTVDAGTTWRRAWMQASVGPVVSVTCPSVTFCMAIEPYGERFNDYGQTTVLVSHDEGAKWQVMSGAIQDAETSVDCQGPGWCTTWISDILWYSANSGLDWLYRVFPGEDVIASTCPSTHECFYLQESFENAQSLTLLRSRGLGSFVVVKRFHSTGPGGLLSCPSATTCYVGQVATPKGDGLEVTRDAGATWSSRPFSTSLGVVDGLTCPNVADCVMTTDRSSELGELTEATTLDGGTTWRTGRVGSVTGLSTAIPLGTVTCPVISSCFAVGYGSPSDAVYHRLGARGRWTATTLPGTGSTMRAVTCPTTLECLAAGVGDGVLRSIDGGAAWSDETAALTGHPLITGLGCWSSSGCLALGSVTSLVGSMEPTESTAFGTTDGGLTWTTLPSPDGTDPSASFSGLECPAPSTCIAATSDGRINRTTDGGATWTVVSALQPGPYDTISALSCGSSSTCLAVGYAGTRYVQLASSDGGATWTTTTSASKLQDLSCVSAQTCWGTAWVPAEGTAQDTGLFETTDGGTSWTEEGSPQPSGTTLYPVWCTAQACKELTYPGIATTTDQGAIWTPDALPGALGDVVSISAPASPSSPWIAVGESVRNGPDVITTP